MKMLRARRRVLATTSTPFRCTGDLRRSWTRSRSPIKMLDRPSIVGGASVYRSFRTSCWGCGLRGSAPRHDLARAPSEPRSNSCSRSPTESPSPGTSPSATPPTRGRSGCRASRCPSSPSVSATGRTGPPGPVIPLLGAPEVPARSHTQLSVHVPGMRANRLTPTLQRRRRSRRSSCRSAVARYVGLPRGQELWPDGVVELHPCRRQDMQSRARRDGLRGGHRGPGCSWPGRRWRRTRASAGTRGWSGGSPAPPDACRERTVQVAELRWVDQRPEIDDRDLRSVRPKRRRQRVVRNIGGDESEALLIVDQRAQAPPDDVSKRASATVTGAC